MSAERNLCAEAGCIASCCVDTRMHIPKHERQRVFPNAQSVMRDELGGSIWQTPGVYAAFEGYVSTKAFETVQIVGECPHLNNNSCTIYDSRPSACKNFEIGSTDCNDARRADNLGVISIDSITVNK